MITYVAGGLFTSPALVITNTVNTKGVMGKGIAKIFRDIYPEMYEAYRERCQNNEFRIGDLLLYRTPHKWILNVPTKADWRRPSHPDYVEAGLKTFVSTYAEHGITSVAFPQLGCGNGGLDWERQVRPLMERYLAPLPIDVFIHIHDGSDHVPADWDPPRLKAWLRAIPDWPSSTEVWSSLEGAIVEAAADAQWDGWTVRLDHSADESALIFHRENDQAVIARDDLMEWWPRAQPLGIVTAAMLPPEFSALANAFLTLLSRVPAAIPILTHSGADQSLCEWIRGVQISPVVAVAQPVNTRWQSEQSGSRSIPVQLRLAG